MPGVLHVLPHRGGGGERYIDLLESLPGYRHERLALSSGREPLQALRSLPLRWPALARRAAGAELLHVHGDVAAALSAPLLRARRRPAVITTHGLHLLRRLEAPLRPVFLAALRSALAGARVTICTSTAERDELAGLLAAPVSARLEVVLNGAPAPAPVQPAERARLRAELGAGDDEVLFLFAGELEPRKDPLGAIAAAQEARRAGAPVVLALAGAGPLQAEVAASQGPAVRTLGFRNDVPALMAAADVFVLPSGREGMSMALLEAMAAGLPAIVCDGSGNPEAVGDAGIVVPYGERGELGDAFRRLAGDAELRSRLGRAAGERAARELSVDRFLQRTRAVYERALAAA